MLQWQITKYTRTYVATWHSNPHPWVTWWWITTGIALHDNRSVWRRSLSHGTNWNRGSNAAVVYHRRRLLYKVRASQHKVWVDDIDAERCSLYNIIFRNYKHVKVLLVSIVITISVTRCVKKWQKTNYCWEPKTWKINTRIKNTRFGVKSNKNKNWSRTNQKHNSTTILTKIKLSGLNCMAFWPL